MTQAAVAPPALASSLTAASWMMSRTLRPLHPSTQSIGAHRSAASATGSAAARAASSWGTGQAARCHPWGLPPSLASDVTQAASHCLRHANGGDAVTQVCPCIQRVNGGEAVTQAASCCIRTRKRRRSCDSSCLLLHPTRKRRRSFDSSCLLCVQRLLHRRVNDGAQAALHLFCTFQSVV